MLLRSLTRHVQDQNWLAVTLDFFIVVVGVYVGIQWGNWNDAQADQRLAAEYLDRIQEDLRTTEMRAASRVELYKTVLDHARSARAAYEPASEPPGQAMIVSSWRALGSATPRFRRSTYDEMVSVGALNKITNLQLREKIVGHYRNVEELERYLGTRIPYNHAVRRAIPASVAEKIDCPILARENDAGFRVLRFRENCVAELSESEVAETVAALTEADIEQELNLRINDLDVKIRVIRGVGKFARETRDFIETNR